INFFYLYTFFKYFSVEDFKAGREKGNVVTHNDGLVVWVQSLKLRSSCSMDVSRFPFDEQYCILKFGSWTYNGLQYQRGRTQWISATSEWDLIQSELKVQLNRYHYECCSEIPYLEVTALLAIRRVPTYYLFTIIIPCLWLTILNLLVFLLPADSGDKILLGVTVFLSLSVFMLVISEKVPGMY
ncbi:neuronal acetylcholine receptor subunit alpha-10-like, partial [Ruditapes philippinarum]|uniref:neuronal acetylcholine receptor subunit alpha-10-like n=1 Tax=Ruditapes philippinarum TaxID=129788 RepID=UPI00295A5F11